MTDFDLQQQLIEARRKQYAGQKDFQNPQGRVVGRTYVAPNPLEYLAAGLRSYSGMRGEQMASDELKQLQGDRQKAITDALRGFTEQAKGVPAEVLSSDVAGPARPSQAPDINAAYASLLQAPDLSLRKVGMEGIVKQVTPKDIKMERVELPTPEGGRRVGFVNINSPNPLATFMEGGIENPLLQIGPAGQAYNPRALQPGQVLQDPNKPFSIVDGKPVPNAAFQDYEKDKAARGAARTNVSVNNQGPIAFDVELAKLDAKQLDQWRDKSEAARSSLSTAQKLRAAEEQGAYSGGFADQKLAAANLISGITGVNPKGLVGSQLYNAEASKLVLEHIKGLGANPSNADREFIEKTVPRLATSKEARQAMVDFIERSSKRTIDTFDAMDSYARENRGLKGFKFPDATPAKSRVRYDAQGNVIQ